MAVYRLRKVWPEYRGKVRIEFRALSLELKNRRSTPKPVVDVEIPLMKQQEPDLPIAPWEFAWHLRHAFFAQSRTICMRFELAEIAREAGLDVDRFLADWDGGSLRRLVEEESHHGWEVLQAPGSPTFVLPSGKQVGNPGGARVKWGPNHEVLEMQPADCPNGDCLQVFRGLLEEAISG